ncbi:MAG: exo-beta-N-acetylmuramidase NamZ domain-containing protein, partial [Candidatus Deferrimicrobium sp.]
MVGAGPVAGHPTENVRTGLDVLVEKRFSPLRGRAVGLVCNPTSVDRRLRHAADLFHEARGVRLAALFGPEHGVRGDIQYMA